LCGQFAQRYGEAPTIVEVPEDRYCLSDEVESSVVLAASVSDDR
jgi:hypothetical protein